MPQTAMHPVEDLPVVLRDFQLRMLADVFSRFPWWFWKLWLNMFRGFSAFSLLKSFGHQSLT